MRGTREAFEAWVARGGARRPLAEPARAAPDVVPIFLWLPAREIAYVKFVFESYEGIALVRTLDRRAATVVVLGMPDFEAQVRAVLHALAVEASCVEIPPPAGFDGDLLAFDTTAATVEDTGTAPRVR